MQHYHIEWDNAKLDWQSFQTKEQAGKEAERLKRPGEKYTIVQRNGECPHCKRIGR